jgi:hypothetical protein
MIHCNIVDRDGEKVAIDVALPALPRIGESITLGGLKGINPDLDVPAMGPRALLTAFNQGLESPKKFLVISVDFIVGFHNQRPAGSTVILKVVDWVD